jgi:hypothetical protein
MNNHQDTRSQIRSTIKRRNESDSDLVLARRKDADEVYRIGVDNGCILEGVVGAISCEIRRVHANVISCYDARVLIPFAPPPPPFFSFTKSSHFFFGLYGPYPARFYAVSFPSPSLFLRYVTPISNATVTFVSVKFSATLAQFCTV